MQSSCPASAPALLQAVLLNWTKGFSASGCVGQDVAQLLRDAAQRKQVGKGRVPLPRVLPCTQTVPIPGACATISVSFGSTLG